MRKTEQSFLILELPNDETKPEARRHSQLLKPKYIILKVENRPACAQQMNSVDEQVLLMKARVTG